MSIRHQSTGITTELDTSSIYLLKYHSFLNMTGMYAIVETGGQQHKVEAGQKVDVAYMDLDQGKDIELSRVLMVADGKDTLIGTPTVDGAKVIATSLGELKGDKVIVFKYKSKTRYRRKTGHRQLYTRLQIKEIVKPGKSNKEQVAAGGDSSGT
jgi:large subunit ribosomal protein L21